MGEGAEVKCAIGIRYQRGLKVFLPGSEVKALTLSAGY